MTPIVWTYLAYLAISILLTVWVARTLHKNGRIFLVDAFRGNEPLADSVNHLLVVGFYLINIGYVTLALKEGRKDLQGVMEMLSGKLGIVLLVLGAMHFFNLFVFSKLRKRALTPPPVPAPLHGAPAVRTMMTPVTGPFDTPCTPRLTSAKAMNPKRIVLPRIGIPWSDPRPAPSAPGIRSCHP